MDSPLPASAPADPPTRTRVVGLGASAGGLGMLEQFLAHVPVGSGLAYVVVQHLDPTHRAMLVRLLQRATAMPVREAADGLVVMPDVVYVIAPNTEVTVAHGRLHVAAPAQPRGRRLPIDALFTSLARDQGSDAIGVVLSGMGMDGTLGLRAIKAQGGVTLAQQPESALFDSMPRSAIEAGCVDAVDVPSALPAHVLQLVNGRPVTDDPQPQDANSNSASLAEIVALLRVHTKHDLSQYKSSTLRRRVQRRMGVHGLASKSDYLAFVRQNPQELELLFKEALIGVTAFFRDPEVWQELKAAVLPALLRRTAAGARLRAWVVGCSTGEEAYSLAMSFREALDAEPDFADRSLQIFASDLSADAIAQARRGWFPARAADEVGPDRLARFFVAHGGGYMIDKAIRATVLFAQHDVIQDPPFTRLDLLSCRNLLIYFKAALQRRLVPLFSYSLRPGGALLLGSSETLGAAHALFATQSPKSRLFWRIDKAVSPGTVNFPIHPRRPAGGPPQESDVSHSKLPAANLQSQVELALLHAFSPPTVLVNEHGDVLYVHGSTGKYLEPASGKANWNIHVMARPAIRSQVAAALRQVLADQQAVQLRGLRLDDAATDTLDIQVVALQEPEALQGLVMIAFKDVAAAPAARARRRRAGGAADAAVADEVQRLKDEVQSLRQEMGASAEELQAANEELQSTNEELQSANEELTTSKEESQSMNEELQTLNSELQSKLDDLALAQSDMQNLLNSTDIATLFLDSALNVRRYTDQITRIVHLREGDIGRPLTDLASTLVYPDLLQDAQLTLKTLMPTEKQITTTDGFWFLVRVKPYRTLANVIQGVVITLVDITAAKELEARLRKA